MSIDVLDYSSDGLRIIAVADGALVSFIERNNLRRDVPHIIYTSAEAKDAAKALLEAVGEKLIPVEDLGPQAADVSFNEGMLRLAAIHHRTVTFRYAKDDGRYIESRRLNPESLVAKDGIVRVVGQDPDREATRSFRLDRIKGEVDFA